MRKKQKKLRIDFHLRVVNIIIKVKNTRGIKRNWRFRYFRAELKKIKVKLVEGKIGGE